MSARPSADPPAAASTHATETTTSELVAIADKRLLGNYRPAPVFFTHGHGVTLFDKEGRRYLDFMAGVAVTALGHAHPRLVRTIAEQAARVMHVSNYFFNEENVLLADELCRRAGYDRAFFCNSGAEANEAVFKLARRHFSSTGQPSRYRFIAFDQSFHGRTVATVTLTGQKSYSDGFGPKLEGITHVPYGDLEAVRKAMGPDVAGIFVEPVQGEGGVLPAPAGFLKGLRDLCDEHGALLLLDEVQTGIGRTGAFLASQREGVEGDVVSLAKGLGGGFPIGAMLLKEKLAAALPPGTHGSTFGGNPLASATARTVLAVLDEENLVAETARKGALLGKFLERLAEKHASLCEGERGVGLLRGLVLKKGVDARAALAKVRDKGVLLTIAGGQVLRFTPPLVVTEDELEEGIRKVGEALSEIEAAAKTQG
jgi:acetylornithine/N-succinyldiaminopimelate aminotransferase